MSTFPESFSPTQGIFINIKNEDKKKIWTLKFKFFHPLIFKCLNPKSPLLFPI